MDDTMPRLVLNATPVVDFLNGEAEIREKLSWAKGEHFPRAKFFGADHYMIDLETLNTTNDAVIVSAGIVHFTMFGVQLSQYLIFDALQQINLGRSINVETMKWWARQSPEAREALAKSFGPHLHDNLTMHIIGGRDYELPEVVPFVRGMEVLRDFFWYTGKQLPGKALIENKYVWSRGAGFDLKILHNVYDGMVDTASDRPVTPWLMRHEMCERTLEMLGPSIPPAKFMTKHNAMHDALVQADNAVKRLQHIFAYSDLWRNIQAPTIDFNP